jgi:hypothetical protein
MGLLTKLKKAFIMNAVIIVGNTGLMQLNMDVFARIMHSN